MKKHTWLAAAAIAAAAVLTAGCGPNQPATQGSAVPGTASPPAAQAPPSQPGSQQPAAPASSAPPAFDFTVCMTPVIPCAGEMRTEPKTIEVSGDGSGFVAGVTWTGWGSPTARGTGTLKVDDCNPNCAQGHLTGYPATITLTGLTAYGADLRAYADMTISAPADSYNETYDHLLP